MSTAEILTRHARRYPGMAAADYGKLLYQSEFGPSHLVRSDDALERLRSEYARASEEGYAPRYLAEDIGDGLCRFHLDPRRLREEDLPLLAAHFLEAFKSRFHKPRLRLSAAALRTLRRYDWPGNVRELKNVLLRAVLAARDDATAIDLSAASLRTGASLPRPDAILTESQMRALQRNNIVAALRYCNNRIYGPRGAAALLQINPTTLCSRMKKFGLPTDAGEKRRTGNPSDKQRP